MPEHEGKVVSREVREYLHRALPNSAFEEVSADFGEEPLLLLTMPQLVAGFGFASSDVETGYGQLYGAFKHHYTTHRREWDRFELAFVLCVPANVPGLDLFGSTIETDVFFCRKYVVPISGDPVAHSLARLPFVPLFSGEEETVRPPTAQTFLQQCGVPPTLARYVVAKGERSPNTIVDACLNGDFERPKVPTRVEGLGTVTRSERTAPMRIDSLEIQNFRAYRKKWKMSFGSNLTVLYGPNGFGKTSVFDAVDFAFTGDIGRLNIKADDRFKRVANHLDSNDADGVVALNFSMDSERHQLVRHVNDRKWSRFDGVRINRKSALEKLTGWRGSTADRVENMVSLFRATHLFSQEHQELAANFRSNCELSSEVVSRLLAFEDYHAGRSKVAQVCSLLRSQIATLDGEKESLRDELSVDEGELETLGRATKNGGASTDWEQAVLALYEKVEKQGLDIPDDMPNLQTLRSWTLTFQTRAANLRGQIEGLRKVIGVVERLPRRVADLEAMQGQVEETKVAVVESSTRRDVAAERRKVLLDHVKLLERNVGDLEDRLSILRWLEENLPKHSALSREERNVESRLLELNARIQEVEERKRSLSVRLGTEENGRSESQNRARKVSGSLAKVRDLLSDLDGWITKIGRLSEVVGEMRSVDQAINELGLSEKNLSESIEILRDEEEQLVERIKIQEERHGELSELLMQIQDHIEGSVCPVCGEDHGTPEALLDRIGEHLGKEIAKAERLRLDGVRQRVEELNTAMHEAASTRRGSALRQGELTREREALETAIGEYERSLVEIGVTRHTSVQVVKGELESLRSTFRQAATDLEEQASQIWVRTEELNREYEDASKACNVALRELERLRADRQRLATARQRLEDDPRTKRGAGLDSPLESVLENIELVKDEIRVAADSMEQERQTAVVAEDELREAISELELQEKDLAALIEDASMINASCRDMAATLAEFGIADGEGENTVLRRIEALEDLMKEIETLIFAIDAAELVLDAATTKAAFSRVQRRVALRRSTLSELMEARNSYVWWLQYFEEMHNLLASEQDKAVSMFTQEYGPRTSAIQRRLRSVYGFDDVKIRSEESRISVRVSRQGAQLRPTDYFSQSQQQTLLLGLFLTASVSQTWSAMAPVFLDDPVTHFDDLNTYAFLDLIDGLLNDQEAGGRQFVVSTCDEKVLQIARQKFAYMNGRARFYTFKGIGVEGPVVA